MGSACGGHSSPPPWWRFLGVSSSSWYGGPSNICGLFAAIATSKTRYGCYSPSSHFLFKSDYYCRYSHIFMGHWPDFLFCSGLHCARDMQIIENDGFHIIYINCTHWTDINCPLQCIFLMNASLDYDCYLLAVFTNSHSWMKGVVLHDRYGWDESRTISLFNLLQRTSKYPYATLSFLGESKHIRGYILVSLNQTYNPAHSNSET